MWRWRPLSACCWRATSRASGTPGPEQKRWRRRFGMNWRTFALALSLAAGLIASAKAQTSTAKPAGPPSDGVAGTPKPFTPPPAKQDPTWLRLNKIVGPGISGSDEHGARAALED